MAKYFISPKGAKFNSLWQRHRCEAPRLFIEPYKGGINYFALTGLKLINGSQTQGVALGYYISPLKGLPSLH